MHKPQTDIVGLIPAAGFARRIAPLPCSKEIYPVNINASPSRRVAASCLLESMEVAGIEKAYMIIREGKWDIPAYFCNQHTLTIDIAYQVVQATAGVPHTIDRAYSFVKGKNIVFGFADILFKPANVFNHLLEKQHKTKADIVLGLFKAANPQKMDMVEIGNDGWVQDIVIKPDDTDLTHTWILAVWNPDFTDFIHTFLSKDGTANANQELYLGHIIQQAIEADYKVESLKFTDGLYLDIGTPEDLQKAMNISGF
jgi:glucose-1-phosphate thymidylyltransferase